MCICRRGASGIRKNKASRGLEPALLESKFGGKEGQSWKQADGKVQVTNALGQMYKRH